jgi:hypothetical protein
MITARCDCVGAPYDHAIIVNKDQAPILPEHELGAPAIDWSITVGRPGDSLARCQENQIEKVKALVASL